MIPQEIEQYLKRWALQIDGTCIETPTSWIQTVRRGSESAVLKLLKPTSDEGNAAELLGFYAGKGAVHLLEADQGAFLMERAMGTRSLSAMATSGFDEEAAEVLAKTVILLHEPREHEVPRSLRPLAGQFASLFDQENKLPLLQCCADAARKLLDTAQSILPLHGDLHHDNVLDGDRRGWLAIDPKALIGERTYEVANLLRNPWPHGGLVHSEARMTRLAAFYAQRLVLDPQRVLNYAFAHAGLSACWDIEDGLDPEYSLACTQLLQPFVDI